jgi:transposase
LRDRWADNGVSFTAWVAQSLVPTLRSGDIVIADNLGSHKGQPARAAIRGVGARLFFLPPYSPDLNPIEMMFAKLKVLLRRSDEQSGDGSANYSTASVPTSTSPTSAMPDTLLPKPDRL